MTEAELHKSLHANFEDAAKMIFQHYYNYMPKGSDEFKAFGHWKALMYTTLSNAKLLEPAPLWRKLKATEKNVRNLFIEFIK